MFNFILSFGIDVSWSRQSKESYLDLFDSIEQNLPFNFEYISKSDRATGLQ
jgi:hypothetical protein